MTARRIALVALVALIAAVLGVCIGRAVLPQPINTGAELHALLHERLDLDAAQHAKLDAIEKDFANKRQTLDAQLRADNARMAEAIAAGHVYGPRVATAFDASHHSKCHAVKYRRNRRSCGGKLTGYPYVNLVT
jgi:nickel and cobalt resistance protein CnrR